MDIQTSAQALYYIAKHYNVNGNTNKMGALKLLFFAEKYHLQQYGRMITNDTFFAMKNGPVASAARDILSFDDMNFHSDVIETFIQKVEDNYFYKASDSNIECDLLSETDIEALDFAINKFGHLNQWELVEETHKYQEWKRYEKLFTNTSTNRENVILEDFFLHSSSSDDPFKEINPEIINHSRYFFFNE